MDLCKEIKETVGLGDMSHSAFAKILLDRLVNYLARMLATIMRDIMQASIIRLGIISTR